MTIYWTCSNKPTFLLLRAPELNALLQVEPHEGKREGENHFPWSASNTPVYAAQDTICLLGNTLCQFMSYFSSTNIPQSVSARLLSIKSLLNPMLGITVVDVKDLCLGAGLAGKMPSLWYINWATNLGVIHRLAESTLQSIIYIIKENGNCLPTLSVTVAFQEAAQYLHWKTIA